MGRRINKISPKTIQASNDEIESFEYLYNLFIRDCKIRNLSKHTLQFYKNELLKFCKRFERNHVQTTPTTITEEIIKEVVILGMMDEGLKDTTINTNLRAVRSFFNFLEQERFVLENPIKEVKPVKEKRTIIQTFSRDQIHALLRKPIEALSQEFVMIRL